MQGYNKNNAGWKHRLEELDALPGEQRDMNAIWEKLHSRRQQPVVRRKAGWYWIAAACLLVLFPFAWLFSGKRTMSAAMDLASNAIAPSNKINNAPARKTQIISLRQEPSAITIPVKPSLPYKKETDQANGKENTGVNDQALSNSNIQLSQSFDSLSITTAMPVTREKMAVVHLNEINGNQNENASISESGRPYFPVKYKTRETLTSNSATRGDGRDNIIRIKLSSQN